MDSQDSQKKVKDAFQRVREDISSLYNDINSLRKELRETREEMIRICEIIKQISITKGNPAGNPAIQHIRQTGIDDNPTEAYPKTTRNKLFSTGNEGVPADRQTDQQTDTTPQFPIQKQEKNPEKEQKTPYLQRNSIDKAAKMLDSLDDVKKDLRTMFKQLTEQEILVFSTIYQLDEVNGFTDYKALAEKLNLTESSIRDYVARLLRKGVPLEKKKINNKMIQVSIPKSLKKIASLSTIMQLREM